MTRAARQLGEAEHALLGLIALRPRHGYELSESFSPGGELGDIFRLHQSLVYAHLKRLETDKLIVGAFVSQGVRPGRVIYSITDAGAQVLRRWLDEPVAHNRDIRLAFLVKLYLSRQLPDHDTAALLARQLTAAQGWVAALDREVDALPAGSFGRLTRDMRRHATAATVAWLASCQAELGQ